MNKILALILSFICTIVFNNCASAAVLVEPYLGYAFGSGKSGLITENDHSYSAPVLGGRFGLAYLTFIGGLDYSFSTFKLTSEPTDGSASSKDKVNKQQMGLFAGVSIPFIRAWGTYYFTGQMSGKDPDTTATQTINDRIDLKNGSGIGLGLGYKILMLSLNAEYRNMSYDKAQQDGADLTGSQYSKKMSVSEILFSVSAPFSF